MVLNHKGLFIVSEGLDRSGKSTHTKKLVNYLRKQGRKVVYTREPGGTIFAESIRKLLLNPKHKVAPLAEIMLYEASRAQNTQEKILPALREGKIVLCERYTMSTLVYQGYGRKIAVNTVKQLNKIATGGLTPDLTIIFDMPTTEFNKRSENIKSDRLEIETQNYRKEIRKNYLKLAEKEPKTFLIKTDRPIQEVQKVLQKKLQSVLKRYKK